MTQEQKEQLQRLMLIYRCAEKYMQECLKNNAYDQDNLNAVINSTNYLASEKIKEDCNR